MLLATTDEQDTTPLNEDNSTTVIIVASTADEQDTTPINGDNSTTLIIIVLIVIIVGLVMLVVVILVVVVAVKCIKRTETLKHIEVNSPEAVYDTIPDVTKRKVG
jgi:flagellar basal body-associated protein FliL